MKNLLLLFFLAICLSASSQVAINTDGTDPDPSAMLDVKSTTRGMLVPRMTQAQRTTIVSPVVGLIVYQTNITSGFYYFNGTSWKRIGVNSGHYVGELYGGGVVFWTDPTGEHGLICSMADLSTSQAWSNVADVEIGDAAHSHWNGPVNSLAIVGQPQHVNSAAQLCLEYTNEGYGTGIFSDWYLPSIGEAIHLMNNLYEVQKTLDTDGNPETTAISDGLYWSSSEYGSSMALTCSILFDPNGGYSVKIAPCYVRAVRAF